MVLLYAWPQRKRVVRLNVFFETSWIAFHFCIFDISGLRKLTGDTLDVRTHPPIVFRFPPPSRETPSPCGMRSLHIPAGGTKTENANPNSNSNPIISLDGLRNGASPYASLDASTQTGTQSRTRLPNPALDIDLRSLNLHLALRVKEIVACAEAMWEWVCEFQMREGQLRRDDGIYASILDLTRAQFDELVLRFEL